MVPLLVSVLTVMAEVPCVQRVTPAFTVSVPEKVPDVAYVFTEIVRFEPPFCKAQLVLHCEKEFPLSHNAYKKNIRKSNFLSIHKIMFDGTNVIFMFDFSK